MIKYEEYELIEFFGNVPEKVDEEKKALLEKLMEGFEVDSVKNEAEFSFHVGENNYTVKLVKHRKKDK